MARHRSSTSVPRWLTISQRGSNTPTRHRLDAATRRSIIAARHRRCAASGIRGFAAWPVALVSAVSAIAVNSRLAWTWLGDAISDRSRTAHADHPAKPIHGTSTLRSADDRAIVRIAALDMPMAPTRLRIGLPDHLAPVDIAA